MRLGIGSAMVAVLLAVVGMLLFGTGPADAQLAGWRERAAAGAKALVRFVDGLAAYRPAAAITVIGHSYGSVVVGRAARSLNRQVRDIVAVASPGMGVDRVGQLRTRARVWAGTAGADWVRRLPSFRFLGVGHGTRPSDGAFGARALPVDGVTGHYDYFRPGTGSLRAMASITLGESPAAAAPPG